MIPIPIIPISQVAKWSQVLHLALWSTATLFIKEMGLDFPRYGGYRFVIELSWINSLSPSHPLGVILSHHPSRFLLLSFPTPATLHCARYVSCLMEIPANSARFRKKKYFFPSFQWIDSACHAMGACQDWLRANDRNARRREQGRESLTETCTNFPWLLLLVVCLPVFCSGFVCLDLDELVKSVVILAVALALLKMRP